MKALAGTQSAMKISKRGTCKLRIASLRSTVLVLGIAFHFGGKSLLCLEDPSNPLNVCSSERPPG